MAFPYTGPIFAAHAVCENPDDPLAWIFAGLYAFIPAARLFRYKVFGFRHMHARWIKQIDDVVESIVTDGRPKVIILGEGGQGKIRSFVNREPSRYSEFVEFRPPKLNYQNRMITAVMNSETLEFNLLMIERLHQRGFSFKVIGVGSSADATSIWLRAELQLLERLGVQWGIISKEYFERVIATMQKWR